MPNYRKMYKDLSNNQEGKFKKIHQRVKMCSESIAFFGGGDREKQMVNERFDKYDPPAEHPYADQNPGLTENAGLTENRLRFEIILPD
eukprot:COSAG01_NODE_2613_length_7380_cov_9.901525_4_plen_88_part_00